jgi:hypothetical protein
MTSSRRSNNTSHTKVRKESRRVGERRGNRGRRSVDDDDDDLRDCILLQPSLFLKGTAASAFSFFKSSFPALVFRSCSELAYNLSSYATITLLENRKTLKL